MRRKYGLAETNNVELATAIVNGHIPTLAIILRISKKLIH